jgi:hypothetical protein
LRIVMSSIMRWRSGLVVAIERFRHFSNRKGFQ